MKIRLSGVLLAVAAVFLGLTSVAHAAVEVNFKNADHYTDVGINSRDSAEAIRGIEKILKDIGARYVSPDQTLKIDVLDIDLAGRQNVLPPPRDDVRVLKGMADWPTIKLHYELQTNGQATVSGEESISDLAYMQSGLTSVNRDEPLHYEKQMLEKWFGEHFPKKALAANKP